MLCLSTLNSCPLIGHTANQLMRKWPGLSETAVHVHYNVWWDLPGNPAKGSRTSLWRHFSVVMTPLQASSGWGISFCGRLNSSVTCGPAVPRQVGCSAVYLPYFNFLVKNDSLFPVGPKCWHDWDQKWWRYLHSKCHLGANNWCDKNVPCLVSDCFFRGYIVPALHLLLWSKLPAGGIWSVPQSVNTPNVAPWVYHIVILQSGFALWVLRCEPEPEE